MPMSDFTLSLLKISCTGLIIYAFTGKIKARLLVLLFIGILLIDFIFSKLEANDRLFNDIFITDVPIDLRPNTQEEIAILSKMIERIECLTDQERTFYEKKVAMHRANAERTWNNAKNKCWYLPNIDKRTASQNAFASVMASFGGTTPMSKLVCSLLALLTTYGIDCISEWHYIEEQLQWCQYHCEMVEFYLTVLEKG